MKTLEELMSTLPQCGAVTWIGLRPMRQAKTDCVQFVEASPEAGLIGDRYQSANATRQITLIQAEHLSVLHHFLDSDLIAPELLRRNIVVKGINLLALKNKAFSVGTVSLKMTGICHPCSRMETLLSAVAVRDGQIIEVGTLSTLKPWLDVHPHRIDDTFAEHILLPGFIDPHLHPSLGALLLQSHLITAMQWQLPGGAVAEPVHRHDNYLSKLRQIHESLPVDEPGQVQVQLEKFLSGDFETVKAVLRPNQ